MRVPDLSGSRLRARRRGEGAAVLILAVLGFCLSACGGGSASPGVATVTSSAMTRPTTTSKPGALTGLPSPSRNLTARALQFSQCMRAHGVSDYPDPRGPDNPPPAPTKIGMTYLGDSFNPNTPTYQAAERVCEKYAVGLATKIAPGVAAKLAAEQLSYAKCMQSHGVPGFPDPNAAGGFTIPNSVDQNSSFFEAAERACKGLLPGLAGPPEN